MTTLRKRQIQRASSLFEDFPSVDSSLTAASFDQDFVGSYGDQVVGKVREIPVLEQDPSPKVSFQKTPPVVVMYVMAHENTQLGGYDLQQSLANAGLVYGGMNIFHRYEYPEGKGRILFNVASAVEPGTIDVANMGAYSTPGLCLFLDCHEHPFPLQSYTLMIHVGKQLAEELNGVLLDGHRAPWTKVTEDHLRDKIQRWVAS
jgi:cell division protein ZipA